MYIRLPQRGIQRCGVQSVSLKLDYNVFLPLYYLPNTNYCGCYLSVVSKNVYVYVHKYYKQNTSDYTEGIKRSPTCLHIIHMYIHTGVCKGIIVHYTQCVLQIHKPLTSFFSLIFRVDGVLSE